ncbi:MAG: histidine phosphatase family protein, partial [Clostridia bacterium]|nr:histidine phosphatase family protein [Clostridia bacterium]
MDIYFVRHGHPNYRDDCLTELGHKHAAAAAECLKAFGIQQIFSSTCGRAYETAEHAARKLNLEIQKCDFMREISCRPLNESARFQKKTVWDWLPEMIDNGESISDLSWQEKDAYCNTKLVSSYQTVTEGIDRWLASLGSTRE